MSTLLLLLASCSLHLGTVPTPGFVLTEIVAPVAEPGVDDAVRGAVDRALSARNADGDTAVSIRVERADWRPGRRVGEVVTYDATLALRFRTGERERSVVVTSPFPDPGTAAAGDLARAAAFVQLAERAAEQGVAWLTLGG